MQRWTVLAKTAAVASSLLLLVAYVCYRTAGPFASPAAPKHSLTPASDEAPSYAAMMGGSKSAFVLEAEDISVSGAAKSKPQLTTESNRKPYGPVPTAYVESSEDAAKRKTMMGGSKFGPIVIPPR